MKGRGGGQSVVFNTTATPYYLAQITAVTDVLDLEGTGEVGFTATWSWYTKTGKSFRKEADMKVEDIEDGDKDKDE